MNAKQQQLLNKLNNFYNNNNYINLLEKIINQQVPMTMMMLNQYAMQNHTTKFKTLTKKHTIRNFDAFRRSGRFNYVYQGGNINTTLGQLNFFKFALKNGIVDDVIVEYKLQM